MKSIWQKRVLKATIVRQNRSNFSTVRSFLIFQVRQIDTAIQSVPASLHSQYYWQEVLLNCQWCYQTTITTIRQGVAPTAVHQRNESARYEVTAVTISAHVPI